MNDQRDRIFVQDSINTGLSSIQGDPLLAQRIIASEKGNRMVRKKVSISFVIALVLVIITLTALAATQWHLFDRIPLFSGGNVPSHADSMIQGNLYHGTINDVDIDVREAGYDGRTLFVQYSYRMLDIDNSYGITAEDIYEAQIPDGIAPDAIVDFMEEQAEEDLAKHKVGWWIDSIWINGQEVEMPEGSGSVITGSVVPGEIIHTEYWRLDQIGLSLEGDVQISLPIGEIQSMSDYYPASKHPGKYDENGGLKLPENGVVTFTYTAGDIQSQVRTFHPDKATETPEFAAKVSEVAFSPLLSYISLNLQVHPDTLSAFMDESGQTDMDIASMEILAEWLFSLQLVDGKGIIIFPDENGLEDYGPQSASFLFPWLKDLPDEIYLAPADDETVDWETAVLVKSAN